MLQRRATAWPWRRPKTISAIDLGGGRLVPPEDLLEGHFHRLTQPVNPQPATHAQRGQDVSVQVSPDMRATIRVVAPTLAPLAQLAEELIARLTFVKPTPQFRADLQRALEDELRRRLGEEESSPAPRSAASMLAAPLLTTLGLAGLVPWILRRREA